MLGQLTKQNPTDFAVPNILGFLALITALRNNNLNFHNDNNMSKLAPTPKTYKEKWVLANMELLTRTVPVIKKLLTGTLPVFKCCCLERFFHSMIVTF